MDRIRNECIRGSLKVAPVFEKKRSNTLARYGHVLRKDESDITKRVMTMNVDGHSKGVSMDMTSDRSEWKKKICCADPT
jgi:hypothetical protein